MPDPTPTLAERVRAALVLADKFSKMSDRMGRHDYEIGDFWNAVEEAEWTIRDLLIALSEGTASHDRMREAVRDLIRIADNRNHPSAPFLDLDPTLRAIVERLRTALGETR